MSIGNFEGSSDNRESSMENAEKKNEQGPESTEQRNEDVDKKMDDHDSQQEKGGERKDSDDNNSEKQSPWERIKSFFKRENGENGGEKAEETSTETSGESDRGKSFRDNLKVDAPSMEQQAADAKERNNRMDNNSESTAASENKSEGHGEDGERTRWSDAQYARDHQLER